jgi:hypothetical protein
MTGARPAVGARWRSGMVRPALRLHRQGHARLTGGRAEPDEGWRCAVAERRRGARTQPAPPRAAYATLLPQRTTPPVPAIRGGTSASPTRSVQIFAWSPPGRVVDGEALYRAYAAGGVGAMPPAAGVPAMTPVLTEFAALRSSLFSEPGNERSWSRPSSGTGSRSARRLRTTGCRWRRPTSTAATSTGTTSRSHRAGAWPVDGQHQASVEATTYNFLPNHITFRGMADPRWWDFETGVTDFGQLDAEHVDLPKLLVMEFALVYGNDWFVVPCRPRSAG